MANGAKSSANYGGQAVIEGVMIRGPRHVAVAVRAPDGEIITRAEALSGALAGWPRKVPIVRGMVVLYETLVLGSRALGWSSAVAAGRPEAVMQPGQVAATIAFMVTLIATVFFALPVLLTAWVGNVVGWEYADVLAEGALRLLMLVGYIALLGRSPDIKRVFAYHGAEHRTIHAYEHDEPLTPERIRRFPNAHPRCGTAFLLSVMVIALVLFLFLGTPPIWVRIVERVALIPVIAALSYEVLRLGQRFGGNPIVAALYSPNLWLQRFTTQDPDDAQIEVAVTALEQALAAEARTGEPAPEPEPLS